MRQFLVFGTSNSFKMSLHRIVVVLSVTAGLVAFFQGFLPLKSHIQGHSSSTPAATSSIPVSKLVLLVVDALRTDFILNKHGDTWPYLNSLITQGHTISYNAITHPPTVTLPRIKALTSGDIPGFVDVIMNFASEKLDTDNILYQLKAAGRKMVFYGDDTWLRLFPNHFVRSEGVTSFFVSDYTEVDHNVSRNLDKELSQTDWDVMILHYLGLDHIGHLIGPFSALVPEKLKEMDMVLRKIHSQLEQKKEDYLILITGDHGMADQGGHGGVTPSEVNVPLVFISNRRLNSLTRDSQPVYQIDITPTLSILCGVPIPRGSLGVILSDLLLSFLGIDNTLTSAVENSKQLAEIVELEKSRISEQLLERRARLLHQYTLYRTSGSDDLRSSKLLDSFVVLNVDMRQLLANKMANYDLTSMIAGLVTVTSVFFSLVLTESTFIITSSSLITSGVMSALYISLYQVVCTSSTVNSPILCSTLLGYTLLLVNIILTSRVPVLILKSFGSFLLKRKSVSPPHPLLCLSILHSLSLLSSSFIEEEHQTAYFFSVTLILGCLIASVITDRLVSKNSVYLFSALVLMSVARKWNQTGDKWSYLSDISDLLNKPEWLHWKALLSFLSLAGIQATLLFSRKNSVISSLCSCVSAIFTALYIAKYDLRLYGSEGPGALEAQIVYATVGVVFLHSLYLFYNRQATAGVCTLQLCWVILTTFLHKTVNLPVMLLTVLIELLVSEPIKKYTGSTSLAIIYYWMGSASYFYQGNSNSLSSVDVSAGYKGLVSYSPVFTGIMMMCNTYSGPVFWILSCVVILSSSVELRMGTRKLSSLYLCMKLFDMCVLLFLIIFERYHLFVWTVFAPKLLYELSAISIYMIFYLVCQR